MKLCNNFYVFIWHLLNSSEAPQSIVLDSSWKDVIKKLTRYSKIFKRFLKTQMFDLTNRFRSKHFCPHRLRNMFSKVLSKLISWKASVFVGQLSFNRVLLPKKKQQASFFWVPKFASLLRKKNTNQQVVCGFSIESENFQSCPKIKAVALQRVETFQNWTDANNSKVMKPWKTISGQLWSSDI